MKKGWEYNEENFQKVKGIIDNLVIDYNFIGNNDENARNIVINQYQVYELAYTSMLEEIKKQFGEDCLINPLISIYLLEKRDLIESEKNKKLIAINNKEDDNKKKLMAEKELDVQFSYENEAQEPNYNFRDYMQNHFNLEKVSTKIENYTNSTQTHFKRANKGYVTKCLEQKIIAVNLIQGYLDDPDNQPTHKFNLIRNKAAKIKLDFAEKLKEKLNTNFDIMIINRNEPFSKYLEACVTIAKEGNFGWDAGLPSTLLNIVREILKLDPSKEEENSTLTTPINNF